MRKARMPGPVVASRIGTMQVRRRTQEERKALTRRSLLSSAVELIAANGIAGVSIPQIAKGAGVTTGAIQHHFGSREALLIAVVADFAEAMRVQTDEKRMDQSARIEDRVAAICRETWDTFNTNHFIATMEILIALRHDTNSFPQILKLMQAIEAELDRNWITYFAEQGLSESELGALRHLMQASLRGLVIRRLYRSDRTVWEIERRLLEAMLTQFLISISASPNEEVRKPSKQTAIKLVSGRRVKR
jgi:AcrR family transcriptional regulator